MFLSRIIKTSIPLFALLELDFTTCNEKTDKCSITRIQEMFIKECNNVPTRDLDGTWTPWILAIDWHL